MGPANAKLTVYGRRLIIERREVGWTQAQVAESLGVSRSTVAKYIKHYRGRVMRGWLTAAVMPGAWTSPRLAHELGMAASTVYGVLKRAGLPVLARLDRSTREVIRYERGRPGELVHVDLKKLGRIPEGGGKRFDEGFRESGAGRRRPGPPRGHDFVHVAVDDHSRYVYAEALPGEKGTTTVGFLSRAVTAFASVGIPVERVLTDNAMNYRHSHDFITVADELGIGRRHPPDQWEGAAFNKTLQREWAYRRHYTSKQERLDALQSSLDDYNFFRPHTAIGNQPPASRL